MNNFDRDNAFQLKVRNSVLAPGFYGRFSCDGRYVFIDKGRLATDLQRRFAVDTIYQSARTGAAVCVEEKIVRWPGYHYDSICLETDSCTLPGLESEGWMHYGKADLLLYAMVKPDRLDVHLYDFAQLQAWFWPRAERFGIFEMSAHNCSRGRVVPMQHIKDGGVWNWHVVIHPNPHGDHFSELFPDLANGGPLL